MSGYSVDITDQDIYAVLQPFIMTVTGLASNLVIQGLPNRAAMPEASPGFVVMQNVRFRPLTYTSSTWDPAATNPTTISVSQHLELTVQIDCYGPTSGDWAAALTMALRNDIGVQALAPTCAPLYCDDAMMGPLADSEEQYEQRWTFGLRLQYNPTITPPQDYADTLSIDTINVDKTYPP